MAAGGSPWAARRVGHGAIQEIVRKTLLTYWNTGVVPRALRRRERLVAGDRSVAGGRRARRCWTGGRCPRRTGWCARSPRRWRRSTPSGPGGCWRRSSTTCPTGTSGARAAASGTATRPRSRRCTSACDVLTLLMAPLTPFITERVWQDVVRPWRPDAARVGAPGGLADGRRRAGRRRAGRADGAGPPAGRAGPGGPGRGRRCAPASRWAGRWSARRAGTSCPTSCARRSPRS